jgi:hypothetical protein
MRILLLLTILQLGACVQQSDLVRETPKPQQPDPHANPSVAVLPAPPTNVPSGQQQYFCTSAVGLC